MSLNIIIPLIIFVLLAAFVVIMVRSGKFPSKRKKGADDAVLDNTPKQEIDYIASAEKMLEQQRFDDAILELKIGAQKSPNNNKIDLKLLSIYAMVNNDFEFKTLYDRIIANSDVETIEAANQIKEEKDAELAQPIGNTDFNNDLMAPAPIVSESSPIEDFADDSFDFDQPTESANTAADDQSWMPEDTSPVAAEDSFDFDPSDISFPEDTADSNSVADIPTETQGIESPSQSTDTMSFDMPSEESTDAPSVAENESAAMPSMDSEEMDWEFPSDELNTQNDSPNVNDLQVNADLAQAPTAEPQPDLGSMDLEWDDSLAIDSTSSVNEQPVEQSNLTTPSADEFDFDTERISDDSDLSALTPDEKTLAQSSLDSLDDSDDKEPLEFVKQIDSAQLTLDLAEQYLEIGEYDSAKRLVKEVALGDATEAQKARAEEILELIY